ncbi:MAG TPA: hypothetical protein VFE47_23475 [Tepidisphaeraceae bacterium]|nr:hypothetical protein [Tepidisphaeraceae bacterium]
MATWLGLRKPASDAPMVDPVDAMIGAQNYVSQNQTPEKLDQAVAELEKGSGIRIVLDWPALEAFGITHEPRKPEFYNSVGTSLRHLLRAYSRTPASRKMPLPICFAARADGALWVSIDHNAVPQLRIYDVHDLLSDDCWGGPDQPVKDDDPYGMSRKAILLSDLRMWLDTDEDELLPAGYVPVNPARIINGKLLMIATPATHAQVARILRSLRALKGDTSKRPAQN